MKKTILLLLLPCILFFSCEGERGEQGPKGDGELAKLYEISEIDFLDPDYSIRYILPQNINNSDMVLIYRLVDVVNRLDVWEPLPSPTLFLNDDNDTSVSYWFNFTRGDVDIFMESNNPDLVPDDLSKNQIFRIVVIPATFAENLTIDISDFNTVMSSLKFQKNDIYQKSSNN